MGLGLASLLVLFAWLLAASTENPPPPTGYAPWRTVAFLAALAATTAFAGHLVPRKRVRRLGLATRVAGWAASLPVFLDLFVYLYVLLFAPKLPLTHSPLLTWHSKLHYLLTPGYTVAAWFGTDLDPGHSHLTPAGYVHEWLLLTALNWLSWLGLLLVARLLFEKLSRSRPGPA